MQAVLILLALIAPAQCSSEGANPIRKVVTLMQNMQKEIEAEGAKEKELFEKFMCYCSGGTGTLKKAIADGNAAIEELTAKLKSETAEKASTAQELIGHKKDRESATADIEEATMLRGKEEAAYSAEKADSETNIAAMAKAIPALEKGMGGAALLQMPGTNNLKHIIESYNNVDEQDRRDALAFLEQSSDYAPQSGQIVGILKAMKDDMEAELKEAIAAEEKAVAGFADLKASKEKEIEMASEAIETKTARAGELAVSVVQTQDALEDAKTEVADSTKFLATLEKDCGTKEKEMAVRAEQRATEVAAISDAIGILNDDDALDVFKKAMPSVLVQTTGFLQKTGNAASGASKAQAIIAAMAQKTKSVDLKLLLFSLNSKIKQKGGLDDVVKMIDDMVVLLGKTNADDEKQKTWCEEEFEKSADEEAATKTKLAQTDATLAELTDAISTLMEEIATLQTSISDLDKSVADATNQRKAEHAEYVEGMQLNEVALGLVEKAKNRLQKFYNPTLYKAAPKTERTMEQKIIDAGTFAQIRRTAVAPPPAPEMPSGDVAKSSKSAGVIGMMDTIIKDLGSDMKEMEFEEKTASSDYAELMADSQAERAASVTALTGKTKTKAETEASMMTAKETRSATSTDLKQVQTVIADLHVSCDFIMQNFDLRKEARNNEIEGLKNAKAVLSGASFSF